jgi:hypothetical protein
MAKAPAFAKAFAERWRIAEMNVWDNGYLDFVERRTPPSKTPPSKGAHDRS